MAPRTHRALWLLALAGLLGSARAEPVPVDEAIPLLDQLADELAAHHAAADYAACERVGRQAVGLARASLAADAPRLAVSLNNLGACLEALGDYPSAEALYQESLDIRVESERIGIVPVIVSCNQMGSVREAQGDVQDALEWYATAWGFLTEHQVQDPVAYVVANNYASASATLGDYETAETLYVWVLQSQEILHGPAHLETAQAQNNLGFLYAEQGRTGEAKALFERSLATWQAQAPGHPHLAQVHGNLAGVLVGEGDQVGAERHLETALALNLAVLGPDHPDVAVSKLNLVALDRRNRDLARDQVLLDEALASLERTLGPDHVLVATGLSSRGTLRIEAGDYPGARADLVRSLTLLEAAAGPEHADLAYPLYTLASLDLALGDPRAARPSIERAVQLFEATHGAEHPELGAFLTAQGAVLLALGEHDAASAALARSVAVAEASWGPASPSVGDALNAWGALLLAEGRNAEALAVLGRARTVLEDALGAGHVDTTGVLNNLAYGLSEQGRYVEARAHYEQALAIEEAAYGPDHPEPAQVLHNLGILLHEQGDAVEAKRLYRESLARKERAFGPVHPGIATTLDKLADLAGWQGDLAGAHAAASRSLAIREQTLGTGHPDVGHSHVQLAMIAQRQGDLAAASAGYARAQAIWEEAGLGGTDMATRVRVLQAGVAFAEHRVPEAVTLLERALAEAETRSAPGEPTRVWIEHRLAQALAAQGELDRARGLVARTLAASEATLAPVLARGSERARLALVRSQRQSLDLYLSLHDRSEDTITAYGRVLRWKGLATRSLVAQQAGLRDVAEPELQAQLAELAVVREELARRTWAGEGEDLVALTRQKEGLERALAEASAEVGEGLAVLEASVEAVCEALPSGGALVDVLRYDRAILGPGTLHDEAHLVAFVLRQGDCGKVHRIPLGPAAPVEAAITRHRGLLASAALTSRSDKAGETVRTLLWDPLVAAVGPADPVLLVPDGAVATVPFGALPRDGRYLLEDRQLHYLETAQDLLATGASAPAGKGALVVGGVAYDAGGVASAGAAPAETRAAACLAELAPLPATADEAQAVSRRLRRGAVVLSGHEATEARVAREAAGKRVVHLATHGFFAGEQCRSALVSAGQDDAVLGLNPMLLSGLALAGANDGGLDGADGVWTAEEIASLDLAGTELVVLSACDTALGTLEAGEGVLGLRRAFTLTGAGTTVMSLWPVDDRATAALMAHLYDGLRGRSAPEALREAQLALLAENRAAGEARPETWAAFIASGGAW